MYRRNSIYGNEDRIILDIGSRFVKAGFSGEPKPRVIKASSPSNITPDLFYLNLQEAEDLEFNLGQLLRTIFHSHLLTDPKQRKVLICESVYLPLELKKLITSVLFWNLQVPSVTFLSSSILALSTLGKTSGVVVDCGNLETSMIPVYDLRPIIPYSKSIPLAGRSVTSRILLLLKNHARAICTERKDDMNPTELSHKMLREITVEKLEDFKIRFCSVSNFSANFKELHKDGYKVYESTKEDIKYPLDINTKLLIPSWIAERAFEVLFEADSEDNSIPSVVLDLLINCSADLRGCLIQNILLVGGTSMTTNFRSRLKEELSSLIANNPKYSNLEYLHEKIVILNSVFKENIIPWIGGSLMGAIRAGGKEILKANFENTGTVPDWSVYEH